MDTLAKALVKAQAQIHNLGKNAKGYGYEYLTLDKIIDETRNVLAECGLVVMQPLGTTADGRPVVKTILMHESGECVEGEYPISAVTMKQCNNAQEMGAAITYGRRYSLAAMLNIAQADDDAASVGKSAPQQQQQPTHGPSDEWLKAKAAAEKLANVKWDALEDPMRAWVTDTMAIQTMEAYKSVLDTLQKI